MCAGMEPPTGSSPLEMRWEWCSWCWWLLRWWSIGNRKTLKLICENNDSGYNFEPGSLLPVPPPRHHPLPHNHPPPLPHRHLLLLEDSLQVIGPQCLSFLRRWKKKWLMNECPPHCSFKCLCLESFSPGAAVPRRINQRPNDLRGKDCQIKDMKLL